MGGDVLYFSELAHGLAARGHSVRVITTTARVVQSFYLRRPDELPPGEETSGGVDILRFPVRRLPLHRCLCRLAGCVGVGTLAALRSYPGPLVRGLGAALARETGVDVIHAGVLTYDTMLATAHREAARRGIPLVLSPFLHVGEPYRRRGRLLTRLQGKILSDADLVLAMTSIERRALIDEGVAAERIQIMGVGCDSGAMARGDAERFRRRAGIHGPIVLHPGTLTHDKGTPHLLEAMKLLWRWGQDASLVLTGSLSDDFDRYLGRQPSWVHERTRLVAFEDREKPDVFAAADVVALPSRAESYGAAYLEAWAAGKPVIGAWAGGVPDVVNEGADGFLVPFADSHRLAEYLCMLLQDRDRSRLMGACGREKVRTGCTWRHRVEKLEALLGQVVC